MATAQPKRPILVVDDEPDMLRSLHDLLRLRLRVHTAGSGAEAIQVLQEHPVHLVMTDQRMPQMTGVEFLRRVRCEHPEAIRMIFTGYADIKAVIDAINQGNVFRYVAKPWDPEQLIATLHEAGAQYDRIVARRRLLADLRAHEEQCLAFEADLRAGNGGTLTPEAAERVQRLYDAGRDLLARLGDELAAPGPGTGAAGAGG